MSQYVLVDTNVISYLFKGDTRGERYLQQFLLGKKWTASFMTVAELEAWALRYQWGDKKKTQLDRFLLDFVIVPFDRRLCITWANVTEGTRRKGLSIDCADAWIAACALLHRVPLVTHNPKDYQGVDGVELLTL